MAGLARGSPIAGCSPLDEGHCCVVTGRLLRWQRPPGFLLETEDPESLGSPRSPLRAGDEVRGGICEATTSLEPDGAGAKAVTELVENTELEGSAIDSPVGSQQLAAPLGGGELESRVLGNPPSSLAIQLSQNLDCID